MRCDYDGCTEWGLRGWTAPAGYERPKRPLRACRQHIAWAEARWIAKYHRTPGSAAAARKSDPEGAVRPPSPASQPSLL